MKKIIKIIILAVILITVIGAGIFYIYVYQIRELKDGYYRYNGMEDFEGEIIDFVKAPIAFYYVENDGDKTEYYVSYDDGEEWISIKRSNINKRLLKNPEKYYRGKNLCPPLKEFTRENP